MNTIHFRLKVHDILNDHAPFPYTLSAFIAFLSDNHCLEILEFIFEARRYRHGYQDQSLERDTLHQQWLRLLRTYIVPGAAREINITDKVRGELLDSVSGLTQDQEQENDTSCPDPENLNPALKQMHDLLHESILQRFIKRYSGEDHSRPISKEASDTGTGTGTQSSEQSGNDTESERQRRTATEIFPFPSPAPSKEELPPEPPPSSRSRSRSHSRLQFKPQSLSRGQSQARDSPPHPRTIKLDDSRPSSSMVFYDDRPDIPSSRKRGSVSSAATASRSMHAASEGMKESSDLVRTRTMPTKRADAEEQHQKHQGQKRRWHRLPLRSGIFRHFKKESPP